MSRYSLWAVLTPGDPVWLESRARATVMTEADEEDGKEPSFEVIPGTGRYHAIVGTDRMDMGAELQLAEELSLGCDEPVYSIDRANDPWTIMVFLHGRGTVLEEEPEALANSLGCLLPSSEESSEQPARKPLRTVALIEGVRREEIYRILEEERGGPLPPGSYRIEETPQGFLLAGGTDKIGFAYITVSEHLPHATVYGVTASPRLDVFFATVIRGGAGIGEFAQPADDFPSMPPVSEIKGERSPERILAALGIPVGWFANE